MGKPSPEITRLKITTWNANSLGNKIEEWNNWLQESGNPDVILIQETGAKSPRRTTMNGYVVWEQLATDFPGARGLAIAVRAGLEHITSLKSSKANVQKIRMRINGGTIIIGNVYIPVHQQEATTVIKEIVDTIRPGHRIILGGDWNTTPSTLRNRLNT